MREFGKIQSSLIKSRKFKALRNDDAARLLYLYFHICPHGNSIGCFEFSPGYALIDLGWSIEGFDRAIKALSEVYLVEWDSATEVVKIVDFLKHTPCTNDKHASGGVKIALSLPESSVKRSIVKDLMADKFAKKNADLIALSKTYESPSKDLSKGYRTTTTTTTTTTTKDTGGESLTRSSAPARDLTEAPPQPKGVIESETPSEPVPSAIPTPSEPSTPPTEDAPLAIPEHLDRRSPEARERFALIEEAISLAQPLKFATKDSFNARQSINALIRQGADPEALRDLAGQCHISQTTHGEFMTRAQKLLPAEIQSAIQTNEEVSHVQRARPVHDPIAAAANAARARNRGT